MFDPLTAALIRGTPPLDDLDRDNLPDQLSESYAKIVSARLRLRAGQIVDDDELAELVAYARRLAFTNEALVSVSPFREDCAAAAFVAATAHQLVFNIERIREPEELPSFLGVHSVSPDIASMLLFLVAEASADALEVARRVRSETDNAVEHLLIEALQALAQGRLHDIAEIKLPRPSAVRRRGVADTAASALYRMILETVQALAVQMLTAERSPVEEDLVAKLEKIKALCTDTGDPEVYGLSGLSRGPVCVFSGPYHLASILIAVAGDMASGAVAAIPPPRGIDPVRWRASVENIAKRRPFLWRNHREAIRHDYLERGVSAAVGFPTGAGKSALAELKISTVLLAEKTVVFLAPTHALVDQTRNALARTFPDAHVQHERGDEFGLLTGEGTLPDIMVMTPEACLTQMTFDASVLGATGLLVFDECHLLHPNDGESDRRALNAMLCVLNFARLVPDADLLLLSAMMKNTKEIAGWLKDLTGRHCLALSLSWKPTRQLRGCVVYQDGDISELNSELRKRRRSATTKGVPQSAKQVMGAQPFGLFSLKQTWATRNRDDYTLLPILDEKPLLGINQSWNLTPNSGEVSSAIAASAAKSGIKTLVFFQTIRNTVSASNKVSDRLGSANISFSDEERRLYDTAARELGGIEYLYLDVSRERVDASSAVHHGLLLPEERRLVEALYKREDGISVLMATSTVAQGMNLPSELVIIANDSRFNPENNRREILKAQELLNAAGRAGRADHNANGIVLVVPGKVVAFNYDNASIGAHWSVLREIFGQSDQCLEIDDPLSVVLDRIHSNLDKAGALERYCIFRLAGQGAIEDSKTNLSSAINKSLKGFNVRRNERTDWIESRTEAATRLLERDWAENNDKNESLHIGIAGTVGLPVEVVTSLAERFVADIPSINASITRWRNWVFEWLAGNPKILELVFHPGDLDDLFGSRLKNTEDSTERAAYAIPYLRKLIKLWMKGCPLCDLEIALGIEFRKLKTCDGARKFVVHIVPSLAYLSNLPLMLLKRTATESRDENIFIPAALSQLSRCVKNGFDTHEKSALNHHLRNRHLSRVELHEQFDQIRSHLAPDPGRETWEGTLERVRTAMYVAQRV